MMHDLKKGHVLISLHLVTFYHLGFIQGRKPEDLPVITQLLVV